MIPWYVHMWNIKPYAILWEAWVFYFSSNHWIVPVLMYLLINVLMISQNKVSFFLQIIESFHCGILLNLFFELTYFKKANALLMTFVDDICIKFSTIVQWSTCIMPKETLFSQLNIQLCSWNNFILVLYIQLGFFFFWIEVYRKNYKYFMQTKIFVMHLSTNF